MLSWLQSAPKPVVFVIDCIRSCNNHQRTASWVWVRSANAVSRPNPIRYLGRAQIRGESDVGHPPVN